jgi:hypothetical protein
MGAAMSYRGDQATAFFDVPFVTAPLRYALVIADSIPRDRYSESPRRA